MSVERELIAKGYPIEDAITLCNSTRRTGELSGFIATQRDSDKTHVCTCGGKGGCKDCPNAR